MRTQILKRASAGFMAAAIAAGMFLSLSLTTSAVAAPLPSAVGTTGITVTAVKAGADAALVSIDDAGFASGVVAIPNTAALAIGDKITFTTEYTPAAGKSFAGISATETDVAGVAVATALFTTTGAVVTANEAQLNIADVKTGKQTVSFTMTAKAAVIAGSTTFVKLAASVNDMDTAFWTSITGRKQITDINATAKTINIYYTTAADKSLWKIVGDTLPTITIGQLTPAAKLANKTILTADQSTDYSTATISKNGKITLNGVEYTVTFSVINPIPQINDVTFANADLQAKLAYSATLTIGGKDFAITDATLVGTTLTFNKVTTLTGAGTITFKGAYLFGDQAFAVTSTSLTSTAGATFTIVYKDNTSGNVTVKANATAITTGSSVGYSTDAAKSFTLMIDGVASTKYPATVVKGTGVTAGLDIVSINLVNDLLPANMQVKVVSTFIAGGSKTVNVKFFDQIFPIELADGSYYYLSVKASSLKNVTLPVTAFDFIGIASSNIDVRPLITWNQTNPEINKTLFIDLTGVMTDRTTNSGVLSDGTTSKIFPSTSYYQPNADYNAAYWFYARWKVGADMFGTSIKYTRPYLTFDITDATSKIAYTYNVVVLNAKQDVYATATNSTLGGQVETKVDTGEYSQKWKQADAATNFAKDGAATKIKGKFNLTSYFAGTVDLATDYVTMTVRLPKGAVVSMSTLADGDIKSMDILQSYTGTAGNTTTDGLVDYVLKFKFRELYTGTNTVGLSTLKIAYPLTNKDNTASAAAFKEYDVVTTWVAKAYIGEKKVTMAGITVPNAIVEPIASSSAASSVRTSSTATTSNSSSISSTSSTLPVNPGTGVPFNAIAYAVTIAASAIGGISTMIIRKK